MKSEEQLKSLAKQLHDYWNLLSDLRYFKDKKQRKTEIFYFILFYFIVGK